MKMTVKFRKTIKFIFVTHVSVLRGPNTNFGISCFTTS